MKTWFTADTHFGHENIIKYCDRPFSSVEEMNETLLDNINGNVSSDDRLVILGDIVMGKLEDGLKLLGDIQAAELILVPGNHDRWSPATAKKGKYSDSWFERAEKYRRMYQDAHPNCVALPGVDDMYELDGVVKREPLTGYSFCQLSDEWEDHPLDKAVFSHFPFEGDSHDADRYTELRPANHGQPVVHGHVHTDWHYKAKQFNVGVDVNDYAPVSEEELVEWVRSL